MKILIIAGEASGDLYGSRLIREMKRFKPEAEFYGVGGEHMELECKELLCDCRSLAVVGLVEILTHLGAIRSCFVKVKKFLKRERPELLILIDYPGFNLRIAKEAKRFGIKVVYYICPQVWAWRKDRVKAISRYVDKALVIFPFEVQFYKDVGVDVEFIGHPLLDSVSPSISQESFKMKLGLQGGERIIALMPGSRRGEVTRILPVMLQGARRLIEGRSGTWRFILILAPTINRELIVPILEKNAQGLLISVVEGHTYEALKASELAFVTSGTATLDAAIIGVPMILLYKLSNITFFIARRLVDVPAIGLVNIVAQERIVPELIQQDAIPERLATEAARLLDDHVSRQKMIKAMARVRHALGEPGAAYRAACNILESL